MVKEENRTNGGRIGEANKTTQMRRMTWLISIYI
jgi:hypothetical protein